MTEQNVARYVASSSIQAVSMSGLVPSPTGGSTCLRTDKAPSTCFISINPSKSLKLTAVMFD